MRHPWFPEDFDIDRHRRSTGLHSDATITALASYQHGVVAAEQLLYLGLTRAALKSRIASRHLNRVHLGIYAVGHTVPTLAGRRMAAVLAGGPGCVLADLCAVGQLGGHVVVQPKVHLIVPPGHRVQRKGIVARDAVVQDEERTTAGGIPCLTWPRALLDISAQRGPGVLADVWYDGVYRKKVDVAAVGRVLRDHHGEPGTVDLRALLLRREGAIGDAANRLEADMRELVVEAGMPEPRSNERLTVDGIVLRPDLYVLERGLAIETDGRDAHEDPEQQLTDAARDRLYRRAGLVVYRTGWWAVNYERVRVLEDLRTFNARWLAVGGRWTKQQPAPSFALARRRSRPRPAAKRRRAA